MGMIARERSPPERKLAASWYTPITVNGSPRIAMTLSSGSDSPNSCVAMTSLITATRWPALASFGVQLRPG